MIWRGPAVRLLAALGATAVGLGFVAGFVTAPHRTGHPRVAASAPPSATPAAPTSEPASAPPQAAPPPAAQPPAQTAVPQPPAAPPAAQPPAVDTTPEGAVADFYRLVAAHRFDAAVRLWTPQMQAAYPPGENIYQRFADTTSLTLLRDQASQSGADSAVVTIDLVEVRAGRTYHWTGNWYVVRQASTWLLDQPALRPA